MNRSRENLPVTISADWRSPIISATIYLRVARRGSIIADVIPLKSTDMAFPKSKQRRLVVDDLQYIACVSENGRTEDGGIKLRVVVQADYGHESLCVISGMVNRDYWMDFPNNDMEKTFAITPRVICELIRYALNNGWDPNKSKTQASVELDNGRLFAIMERVGISRR